MRRGPCLLTLASNNLSAVASPPLSLSRPVYIQVASIECAECQSSSGGYDASSSSTHEEDGSQIMIQDGTGQLEAMGMCIRRCSAKVP